MAQAGGGSGEFGGLVASSLDWMCRSTESVPVSLRECLSPSEWVCPRGSRFCGVLCAESVI